MTGGRSRGRVTRAPTTQNWGIKVPVLGRQRDQDGAAAEEEELERELDVEEEKSPVQADRFGYSLRDFGSSLAQAHG